MPDYYRQTIELIIDKDGDLYQRICAAAGKEGISVERVFSLVASVGVAHHMRDNLEFLYERDQTAGRRKRDERNQN